MSDIEAFRIEVPDAVLDDLHDRIDRTRWPDELPGVGWDYGIPQSYLRELADYWRHSYDWRVDEARINQHPQFLTTIDGAQVHFIHVRSPEANPLPLVLTHGWPGSIVEFLDLIEPLSDPAAGGGDPADAFDVVVPSIPGYGFSGPTRDTGWNVARIAQAWAVLMERLGYDRYGAQGGDWGSAISRELGRIAPEHVVGVHLNFLLTGRPRGDELNELTDMEKAGLEAAARFLSDGRGYAMIQGTRPQTVGYALTDSPVGQLAWIAEKFREWTDSTDRPEDAVDRDRMLANITIYWVTATAASSARLYYEAVHGGSWAPPKESPTPTGIAVFPREIAPPIRRMAERTNNIVHWTEFDRGGHFAAMEEPDLLLDDIRAFFRPLR